jgi:thioredoxin-like negative regulator of GroEL
LKETGNYDDAVETFKLAMSLEPDNWYAQWGLSETYMQQKKYDPALEILQKVRALIESGEAKNSGPADALDSVIRDIAVANRESGNSEIAWEIYESMLKKNPDDYEAAFDMISALHAKGNYTRILEFLERLKKSIEETSGHDRRTRLFHVYFWNEDYHDTLAAAASDPGGITAIKDSYQAAIDAADKNLHNGKDQSGVYEGELKDIMAYLLHYYAKLLYNNNTSTEEKEIAYSMWVRIVQFEDNKGWYLYRAQIYAIQHLATLYYQEARLAGIGTELATKYIDDLEQITISGLGNPAKWAKEQFPKQILARYYALTGETEKVKNTLRPLVKANLDLLSDDDHNDWQPLDGLSLHFMYSGQDENCLAAWSLIKPDYVEEEREEDENATQATDVPEATSPEKAEKRLEGPLRYVCDGMCGKEWSYPDDIYFCRDCHEVMFDEGCLKKLRDGTLKVRNCQKTHEMLHAPKYDAEELEKVGKGNVKVGQEITRVEDWIQSIKQDWGISME